MAEKDIVYVVTSGEYSDYCIRAVFSSREGAEEYTKNAGEIGHKTWAEDTVNIEEWNLDNEAEAKMLSVYREGLMLDDGSVKEVYAYEDFVVDFGGRIDQLGDRVPAFDDRPIVRVSSTVSAEHAHKLAAEARQKWLRESSVLKK